VRNCHCLLCSGGKSKDPLAAEVADRGWYVLVDAGDGERPASAFTIGLWHSFDHAELALFDLDPADMAAWLEGAAEQVAAGRILCPDGRPDGVLGALPVVGRPVLACWHRHFFAGALRFYRGQVIPILQLVWADAPPRLWQRLEAPPPPPPEWPFPVSPDALVLTTRAAAFEGGGVAGVVHDEDGEWQFLHGPYAEIDELIIVHLAHIAERHPGLPALADLPPGWEAWRHGGGEWRRTPLEPDPE